MLNYSPHFYRNAVVATRKPRSQPCAWYAVLWCVTGPSVAPIKDHQRPPSFRTGHFYMPGYAARGPVCFCRSTQPRCLWYVVQLPAHGVRRLFSFSFYSSYLTSFFIGFIRLSVGTHTVYGKGLLVRAWRNRGKREKRKNKKLVFQKMQPPIVYRLFRNINNLFKKILMTSLYK